MKGAKLFFILTVLSFLSFSCNFVITKSNSSNSKPQLFLLTYLPNGSEGDIFEEEILSDTKFTVKENFYEVPQDKKFAYWNTRRDGRGTTYTEGETIKMPYYDLYLFAHWIDGDAYSIVYKNCENANNILNPSEFGKTDKIILAPAVKNGYIFEGWYFTEDFSDEAVNGWEEGEKNSSVTVYAKWTAEKRTVTYKAGIGSGIANAFDVDYDTSLVLSDFLFIPPKNKKFTGWKINGEMYNPGETYAPVQNDLEITAEYEYFARGDVTRSNIEFNGKVFENTAEVCVIPPATSYLIEGSDNIWNSYLDEDVHNDFKGAFVEGRNVSLEPYAVSKFMVTRELFREVLGNLSVWNSQTIIAPENPNLAAASGINWYMAIAFCNKLTLLTGGTEEDLVYYVEGVDWETVTLKDIPSSKNELWNNAVCDITKPGYRLLSEAEWEFAARGGDSAKPEFNYAYPGFNTNKKLAISCSEEDGLAQELNVQGYMYNISSKSSLLNWSLIEDEVLNEYAWLNNNSDDKVHQTGFLKPNTLGVYDMAGNLWEWVWDYYSDSPIDSDDLYKDENGIVVNPLGPKNGSYRIRKGSNYQKEWGYAVKASSGYRGDRMEEFRSSANYGLRIGRSLVN